MARKRDNQSDSNNHDDGQGEDRQEESQVDKLLKTKSPLPILQSELVDNYLAKVITVTLIALMDIKHVPAQYIAFEETRVNTSFLYYFENTKLRISGYAGRDHVTNQVTFLAMDRSRFRWARLEGVIDDEADPLSREKVFNDIGVFRRLDGVKSFICWLSGDKDYVFVGPYITQVRAMEKA